MAAHLTHKPQGVAFDMVFKAYLSSDHISNATGKTIAVQISKNHGAFGNPSAGAVNMTEIANGWYWVNLSATDIGTLGPMILRGTSSGVDDVEAFWNVVDAHNAGFDGVFSATATGDAFARIGANGAGLTSLASAANLATAAGYIDTEVAAIKAKTDSLTFTVAGQVDANVQAVNDVTVTGNGQIGTEWGP